MDTSDPVVFASVATAALVLFLFIWRIVFFFTADGTSFPLPVPLVLFIRCVFVFRTADGRKFKRAHIGSISDLTLLLKGPPPEGAFEDKVVWITGGSQGIGQELAQRFAAMGARLILSSRSADRLEAVRATCRGKHAPEGVVVLPFDLKGGADVLRGAVRQAESAFRGEGACGGGEEPCGVDVLVLNAAHPRPKLTCEDTPEDTLRGMLEVNVVATIELTRYLLPCMMQRNKGQILVVSSAAGKLPAPTQGVYAATKHALHGYFNTLRYEAVQHGVAVTLVCPGPIATEGSAEGAVKLATKPSADQLHVPAAAGGDEKDSRMPASQCAELIVSATACSSLSPSSLHPTHCSASCPPHLAPHFPSLSTGLAHASIAMCRAHSERCCLEARRSMDLQTSGAATHVPRTIFPCYLQHALQKDWPQESASTQDRQQQHVFDEPPIHPHILFLFLLTHLSFLLPPLDLLYLFPQPFTLPHTPTPCNPSTPQVPLFPIPHPHTFPHTLTHTSAKVYHPLPSFLPSSLLFPSLLPLLSVSLPLIPLTRPLSPPFTHLGPSPPLLATILVCCQATP
ncbi:unnamed protein product [Closterium sp. Naga37s-1]|nr:unnamed protein product [Closterium sp. Naga37s-1]